MSNPRDSSPPLSSPTPAGAVEGSSEAVATEDLLCLQSAIEEQQPERERLLSRSHAEAADAQVKLHHTELRLQQSMNQLAATKRSAHAVRVRLEADVQAARARAQETGEALATSQAINEQLRIANAELNTALDAAQWRLSELEAESARHHETLIQAQQERRASQERLAELDHALAMHRQTAADAAAQQREAAALLGALQSRVGDLEAANNRLHAERKRLGEEIDTAHLQRAQETRDRESLQQRLADLEAERETALQRARQDLRNAHEATRAAAEEAVAGLQGQLLESERGRAEALQALADERTAHAAQLRALQDAAAQHQTDLAGARDDATRLQAELVVTTERCQHLEQQLATAHAECLQLEARSRSERDAVTERLSSLEATLRDRETVIDQLRGSEDELQRLRATQAEARNAWQEQNTQHVGTREALERRVAVLEEGLRQRDACTEQLRHDLAQLEEQRARIQQEAVEAARRRDEEWRATYATLQKELDAARRSLSDGEATRVAAERDASELQQRHGTLAHELADLQKQSALAKQRHDAAAGQIAELEHERSALGLRLDELTALSGQLERECDRLRRDRGSTEETRRLKADNVRLEAKIVDLDRQRTEAVQRHSAAVAGYMVELNQRSEALHARELELQRLTEELTLVKQSCEDAMGELEAQRREQAALERQLAELRTALRPGSGAASTEPTHSATPAPSRAVAPPPVSTRPPVSTPARRAAHGESSAGPVTLIHLEDSKAVCEAVRDAVSRLPDSRYLNAIDTTAPNTPGSRVLVVNLLTRAHDPIEAIASFTAAATYQHSVLAYCAEGGSGFSFGMADFFTQPIDPDACVARLMESLGAIQRLLVVTENFSAVGALRAVLSRMRSSVSAALDLRQVFDLLPMVEPDVLLIDLALPRGEGLRLVSRLRSDPKTRDLPLGILLAAQGNAAEFRQHALRASRNLPMAAADLVNTLREHLGAPPAPAEPGRGAHGAGALA